MNVKSGILTSEFWLLAVSLVLGVLKKQFPDIPNEAFYTVIAYILSRLGIKAAASISAAKIANATSKK